MTAAKTQYKVQKDNLEQAITDYIFNPDEEHLSLVVMLGRRLVYYFANLYSSGAADEDVIQAGYEGLVKAANRYQPERGVTFATFASHYIMGEIRHHLRKEASFHRPAWAVEILIKVNRFAEDYLQKKGEPPSLDQIATAVNISAEGIKEAMRTGLVSLEEIDLSKIRSLHYQSFKLPIEERIILEQATAS